MLKGRKKNIHHHQVIGVMRWYHERSALSQTLFLGLKKNASCIFKILLSVHVILMKKQFLIQSQENLRILLVL